MYLSRRVGAAYRGRVSRRIALALAVLGGCGFEATQSSPGVGVGADAAGGGGGGGDSSGTPVCPDADQDGACDSQLWLCGAEPMSPGNHPFWGDITSEAWWSHNASLGGLGRFVVGKAGGSLALTFTYDWRVDCPASTCQAQLEVGLVSTATSVLAACVADKVIVDRQAEYGRAGTATLALPAASGVYDVRLLIGKRTACGASFSAPPADNQTIAKICVP